MGTQGRQYGCNGCSGLGIDSRSAARIRDRRSRLRTHLPRAPAMSRECAGRLDQQMHSVDRHNQPPASRRIARDMPGLARPNPTRARTDNPGLAGNRAGRRRIARRFLDRAAN